MNSARTMIATDLVANTTNGADQRVVGARIHFAAEIVNVDVDDVGDGIAVNAPDFLDDGGSRNGMAWIPEQEFEESVFLGA